MLARDWSSLTAAGAFIAGAVLAAFAMLRLLRVVFGIRRAEERKDDDEK